MIRDVYITRIKDEGDGNRKFGFGVTDDEMQATYIEHLREDAEHERIESALLRA